MRRGPYKKRLSLEQRFWAKVAPPNEKGCRLWTSAIGRYGYGAISGAPESRAHRLAWRLTHGPIPPGMWVLHHCDVRACCNVDHLFLGTAADNTADMIAKGRADLWGWSRRKAS